MVGCWGVVREEEEGIGKVLVRLILCILLDIRGPSNTVLQSQIGSHSVRTLQYC